MKSIRRQRNRIIFGSVLGTQWLLPFASVLLFQRRFTYGFSIVCYHLLLVESAYGLLLGVTSLAGTAGWLRSWRASRYLLPLAWGSLTVGLYYVYLLAWGGRLAFGMNMRFAWAEPYVFHPSIGISTFSISPVLFWGVLVGIPLAILAVYAVAARPLAAAGLPWLLRLGRWRRSTPHAAWRVGASLVLAALAVCALSVAACDRGTDEQPKGYLFDDPILACLFDENTTMPLAGKGNADDALGRTYAAPDRFQKKNVVLIVIDACRADHLGVLGYGRDTTPFLDALGRSGHLRTVRSYYSASCCTYAGVVTMLRSRHWFKMTQHGFSLQDALKRAGYQTHFLLSGDLSTFCSLKSFYGPNVDSFSDGLDRNRHYGLNDDRGIFESFVRLAPYDGTPSFLYLHLMSAHSLGQRMSDYALYTPANGQRDPVNYGNGYDNGIRQADSNIYEIFKELKRKGYLQNCVVFVTGDHGNLDFARQVDIAPTILDRLGLPIPPGWDGRSLLRADEPRLAYLRYGDTYAVVNHAPGRTLKYIYDARVGTEEVFDDTQDPHEQRNILDATDPQQLEEMRRAILAFAPHPGS